MKKPEIDEIYKWSPKDKDINPTGNKEYLFKVILIHGDNYNVEYLKDYPYAKTGTFSWPELEKYWIPVNLQIIKSRFELLLENTI